MTHGGSAYSNHDCRCKTQASISVCKLRSMREIMGVGNSRMNKGNLTSYLSPQSIAVPCGLVDVPTAANGGPVDATKV